MTPILHNFSLQAGGSHYPSVNTKMQEAFANMILEECIKLAEKEEDRYLDMGEVQLAFVMQNFQALVRHHFEMNHGREAST